MGVWRPERIVILGRDFPRTRFTIPLLVMIGAVIIFAIAVVPLVVGSLWFPQTGASLLTGFGAGMIVILLPPLSLKCRMLPSNRVPSSVGRPPVIRRQDTRTRARKRARARLAYT